MPAPTSNAAFATASVVINEATMSAGPSAVSHLKEIDAELLTIERNPSPAEPNFENLAFGRTFTPHMLIINWNKEEGWGAPAIKPYGPLAISPAAPALHYASGLFEGMKAYRSSDGSGKIRLFRPDKNMERMNRSAARAGLPTFNGDEFVKLIKMLVRLDRDYVPHAAGQTLYLRPTLIGTPNALDMGIPTEAMLYCICSPVGNYYTAGAGAKPVSLLASTDAVRAWPGGTGCYKLAANYVGAVMPALEAQKRGYQQVLWLFGPEKQVTEVGAMNFFLVRRKGEKFEVATAPLDGYNLILPGVTRDTILSLLRSHVAGEVVLEGLPAPELLEVNEREITMGEIVAAVQKDEIVEVFGSGTAACVCSVERIGYEGSDLKIPVGSDGMNLFTRTMLREVTGRQWGIIASPQWSHVC